MCLAIENGNGTLAKLVDARNGFLQDVQTAVKQCRDNYLTQVVDITLNDPRLTALNQLFTPPPAAPAPASETVLTPDGAQEMPTKQPMKRLKTMNCPGCGAVVPDMNARFCSRCASPLFAF